MSTIDTILAAGTDRDTTDSAIYDLIGITGPGACAIREPDGRLMIWASEADSVDDDGAAATYLSRAPISDAAWKHIQRMAWIEDSQAI